MKSYILGDREELVHNNRGYELENGKIKDFFNSVPISVGDIEIALRNKQVLEIIDEADAFKIYFEDFWGGERVRDLLLECFIKDYTVEETYEIIGRAYPKPIEGQLQSVKEFIKKHTGEDWK